MFLRMYKCVYSIFGSSYVHIASMFVSVLHVCVHILTSADKH